MLALKYCLGMVEENATERLRSGKFGQTKIEADLHLQKRFQMIPLVTGELSPPLPTAQCLLSARSNLNDCSSGKGQ